MKYVDEELKNLPTLTAWEVSDAILNIAHQEARFNSITESKRKDEEIMQLRRIVRYLTNELKNK